MEETYYLLWDNGEGKATLSSPAIRDHSGPSFTLDRLNEELSYQHYYNDTDSNNHIIVTNKERTEILAEWYFPVSPDISYKPKEYEFVAIKPTLEI